MTLKGGKLMISTEDRLTIYELISLHGHLVDEGRLDELDKVFIDEVTYDLSAFGMGVQQGLGVIREAALALGDNNPVGHHVTNIVIDDIEDGSTVHVRSKGVGIKRDGTTGSVVYVDVVKKQDGKWRIVSRKIFLRHKPLSAE